MITKKSHELRIEGNSSKLREGFYKKKKKEKPTFIPNVKDWFVPKIGNQLNLLLSIPFDIILENPGSIIKQDKGIQILKKEIKLCLFRDDIIYIEKSKKSLKKPS